MGQKSLYDMSGILFPLKNMIISYTKGLYVLLGRERLGFGICSQSQLDKGFRNGLRELNRGVFAVLAEVNSLSSMADFGIRDNGVVQHNIKVRH